MGAPILIDDCSDLWVSNSSKDWFCEIVVAVAKLEGRDISNVFEDAPGIAGTYGVSGMFINANEFFPYFGGRAQFQEHLEVCTRRLREVCDGKRRDRQDVESMYFLFSWAIYMLQGGVIDKAHDYHHQLPPDTRRDPY
jgi:hypothetical protein